MLQYQNYWIQKKFLSFLLTIVPTFIKKGTIKYRVLELKVNSSSIYSLSLFLKKHTNCLYKTLVDMCVYDKPGKNFRFSVIYNLLSQGYNSRLLLVTKVTERSPVLASLLPLYSGSGWLEREVWDFFGIFFINNFDLRRLLSDYGFAGHPLRKDFPLTGFVEVVYDDSQKHIIYRPVELVQDFRGFKFKKNWK